MCLCTCKIRLNLNAKNDMPASTTGRELLANGPQHTSDFVMGDRCLLVEGFPGLLLNRAGVLFWKSRTFSAKDLKGLL